MPNSAPSNEEDPVPRTRISRAKLFSRNLVRSSLQSLRNSTRSVPLTQDPSFQPKPIYIYPGLIRVVREKAVALDNQCPAVLYKCRDCRRLKPTDPHQPSEGGLQPCSEGEQRPPLCSHRSSCPICLDDFHSKDLVRKLPCDVTHVFHSKCILDWFVYHHRCPLCNGHVANIHSRLLERKLDSHRSNQLSSDPQRQPEQDLRRVESFRTDTRQSPTSSRNTGVLNVTQRQASDVAPLPDILQLRSTPSSEPESPQTLEGQTNPDVPETPQSSTNAERGKKKTRNLRKYSYIVHDNVRMELNPFIPV